MTDTNSNNNNNDDAEKMRLAFEQFMLSGGKNSKNNNNSQEKNSNEEVTTPQSTSSKSKKKKKKKRQSTGATSNKVVSTPAATIKQPSPQQQQPTTTPNPKIKKRYYQLLRSFNDKVKHTWIDIDEQLLSVLQNIVSIRGRVPHEWKVLSQATRYYQAMVVKDSPEQEEEFDNDGNHGDDWKSYGHQETSSQSFSHHLRIDDIQLALSHDLEQHEKMLTGLRSLMSNMAECHDALGRIVDNLWQFHFEVENNEGMNNKDESLEHIVTCVTSLYQMLSVELYRKQNMIPMVIDSMKDEILGMNELGKGHDVGTKKSQTLVRECCKSWKRSSSDEELLLSVMKLGES
mmetsp:Transcript_8785/g.13038  ORF Transcript_8785/g.13038 Transcript_8785/m.13038 type:complete len:345 (+) Transcript_8785:120-1154(+)